MRILYAALIEAGKAAFTQTHTVLLTTAAGVIAMLAVVVFLTLAGYRSLSRASSLTAFSRV
ncbi:hypothetical protein KKP04_07260 [Rhodomicrobium sp. Az07]|uniref:hypothetical protein n=1 Tax=Rhodomicrobium sp. Az07 TaxID=2839034 RepID=UPI001BEB6735|nr:hypothetical protein [Rhodomicrobium sp. Az07]MBT3070662.1 hypothetical protein [Rhodomicrobium sp. Az07]